MRKTHNIIASEYNGVIPQDHTVREIFCPGWSSVQPSAQVSPTSEEEETVEAVKPTISRILGREHAVLTKIDLKNDEVDASSAKIVAQALAKLALCGPKDVVAGILGADHEVVKIIEEENGQQLVGSEAGELAKGMAGLAFASPAKMTNAEKQQLVDHTATKQVG
ncbi:uncharacterized protein LTR77_006546 [Saxophila tyrrhenica]|uniref:Uncharacterized protein n=1 Tax=Saxophila tyrrhenica TaxID=1690608 RepID=A0AAV9P5U0_9PEZI|nr:hypothetical protein LTR77_006546 [Saxophila tyrrhenica]